MILIYLLKVSACTLIFFAAYKLLLAKLTFFNLNRAYLLLMLVLSFIIPALTIENRHEVTVASQEIPSKIAYSNDGFVEQDFIDDGSVTNNLNWNQLLMYGYCLILATLVFRMLFMMVRIQIQLRKHAIDRSGAVILVDAKSTIKNCSFFNQIIVDSSLQLEEKNLVIKHESVHVKQWHAFDKLLVNLVTAILWFNPIIYFWRNAIDHNHEFLADRETSKVADKKLYASLLLNLAMPAKNLAINSFSKLPLKNRIMMLYKEPNAKLQKLAYLAIIPVLMICCMAFINRKEIIVEKKLAGNLASTDAPVKPNVYAMNYLNSNIKVNPNNAFNEVEPTLIIDAGHGGKDGAVSGLDGQKEKDLNLRAVKILKEEAAKRGIKVILTRTSDQFISLRDRLPKQDATAFISIHHNATLANAAVPFSGIEIYVSKLNSNIKMAEDLGAGILSKLKQQNGLEVRDSLKNASLLLLRESKVPAVLIELGNISDSKTLNYINQEKNIRRISNLILDGFVAFSKRGC
ncbi:N-acetylmuramoyl-L-alanine amidase [Pedobacter psychrodurus]|uniref:N-acetylmuramoyl-L-alanine amidase n=1 Tax=Pedobacter psychrodurus TaxID=2530456 RepID=A0A4R0Q201_9SPHI|nr:N-acetylmuramoyl-L-alanine amidase [Pedobacter psychrodurus]TCD27321.1 N-acetylmuramoyl-L-alanine amidase [Pedobacter psychrodurus]